VHYSEQEFANPNLVALTSMQGVVEILKIDNMKELTEAVGNWYSVFKQEQEIQLLELAVFLPEHSRRQTNG
jgi:hypothetical protein